MDKYSTLDTVARQLITGQMQPDERRYYAYLSYGYDFLNGEYPAGTGGGNPLKTTLLDVGPGRVAQLPHDYVEFVSVGRVVGDKVRNLSYNAALAPEGARGTYDEQTGYYDLNAAVQPAWPCFDYWASDGLLPGWDGFGYGWGEFTDEFAIDRELHTIRFSTLLGGPEAGPLVFQYQSNDHKPGTATPIHPYWQRALKSWMLWQWYLLAKEDFRAAAEHAKIYASERNKALARTDPTTLYDMRSLIYQCYNTLR